MKIGDEEPLDSTEWEMGVDKISISVDSWIIQDGNYEDFSVDDERSFALEFVGSSLRPSVSNQPFVRDLGLGSYEVRAQVLFAEARVWVVDFGLRAFWQSDPPEFAEAGAWLEGEISVGIDPYFYMEYLNELPGMPNLYYPWKIASIMRNETPWLAHVTAGGPTVLTRDWRNESSMEVGRTDAWNDDHGRASYVLALERRELCLPDSGPSLSPPKG